MTGETIAVRHGDLHGHISAPRPLVVASSVATSLASSPIQRSPFAIHELLGLGRSTATTEHSMCDPSAVVAGHDSLRAAHIMRTHHHIQAMASLPGFHPASLYFAKPPMFEPATLALAMHNRLVSAAAMPPPPSPPPQSEERHHITGKMKCYFQVNINSKDISSIRGRTQFRGIFSRLHAIIKNWKY